MFPIPNTTGRSIVSALVIGLLSATCVSAYIPTNGLTSRYMFNGTGNDAGPNPLNAVNHGATPDKDRFGKADRAFKYDGVNDYMQIADHTRFSVSTTGGFSISVWMRPDVLTFPNEQSDGYVHWMGKGGSGQHEWTFRMYGLDNTVGRGNRCSFYLFNLGGGLGAGAYVQPSVVRRGEWVHFVTTVSVPSDFIRWYRNGNLVDEKPFQNSQYNINPQNGSAPVRIGTRDFLSYFKGAIDDICFYNRVLNATEIKQLYTHNSGSSQDPAVKLGPASVTASSSSAANAVDGDMGTSWSVEGASEWLRFDLGSVKTISYLKIAFRKGDLKRTKFTVQKSTDDVSWTDISGATNVESSGLTDGREYFDFNDFDTRYLRIRCFGSNLNLWTTISEAEVWGK